MAKKRNSRVRQDGSPRQTSGAHRGAEQVAHESAIRNIQAQVDEWQAKVEKFERMAKSMPSPFKEEAERKAQEAQQEVEFFKRQFRMISH